jgi:hypothetical protein
METDAHLAASLAKAGSAARGLIALTFSRIIFVRFRWFRGQIL